MKAVPAILTILLIIVDRGEKNPSLPIKKPTLIHKARVELQRDDPITGWHIFGRHSYVIGNFMENLNNTYNSHLVTFSQIRSCKKCCVCTSSPFDRDTNVVPWSRLFGIMSHVKQFKDITFPMELYITT